MPQPIDELLDNIIRKIDSEDAAQKAQAAAEREEKRRAEWRAALANHLSLLRDREVAHKERLTAESAFEAASAHPVYKRYERAPIIASNLGIEFGVSVHLKWIASGLPTTLRHPSQFQDENWPAEIKFTPEDRLIILDVISLKDKLNVARNREVDLNQRHGQLLERYPMLREVK